MDYYEIGQRIRKYRKAQRLSQEELSEKVGISVTHMSHIETGNTKLSLPVLVELAAVLEVRTDDLLFDAYPVSKTSSIIEISQILESCSAQQALVIKDIVNKKKISLDKHL